MSELEFVAARPARRTHRGARPAALLLLLAMLVPLPVSAATVAVTFPPDGSAAGTVLADTTVLATIDPATALAAGDVVTVTLPAGTTLTTIGTEDFLLSQAVAGANTPGTLTAPTAASAVPATSIDLTIAAGTLSSDGLGLLTITVNGAGGPVTLPETAGSGLTVTVATPSDTGSVADVDVVHAAAAQLAVVTQPAGAESGVAFTTQPVVEVQDPYGNAVTTDPDGGVAEDLVMSIATAPSGATLAGTVTSGAVNWATGRATWADLELDVAGDYTLTATVNTGLTGVTSTTTGSFTVIGGAATATSQVAVVSGAITADQTTTVTVSLRDSNNNALVSGGDTVLITADLGTVGAVTDGGDGTYTATYTATTAGSATISATVNSASIADTDTVTVTPGAATTATSSMTAAASTVTTGDTTTVTLTARDADGNALTTGGSTVIFTADLGTVGAATDVGDGTYTATYTAPSGTGSATIGATLDGPTVTATATITVQAPTSPTPSTSTTTSSTATAGGTVSTGSGTTAADPLAVSVTTPVAGAVEVTVTTTTTTTLTGTSAGQATLLEVEFDLTVPASTSDDPVELSLEVDASTIGDTPTARIVVVRDGALVPRCTGPGATPDPCLASVTVQDDGDVVLDVRTSRGSTWNVARVDTACVDELVTAGAFGDVTERSTHAEELDCAAFAGLVLGTGDGDVEPDRGATRGETASVLDRVLDLTRADQPAPGARFPGVAGVHGPAVEQLAASGVVDGTADGTFQPSAVVTRGEATAMLVDLYDAAGGTVPTVPAGFVDVDGVFADRITAAVDLGLVDGVDATTFAPTRPLTRGELATMATRLLDLMVGEDLADPSL